MSTVIAKRYVKALLESFKGEELTKVRDSLKELSSAFDITKFKTIISTPDVSKENKKKLIISILKYENKKLINFISLLNENGRLLFLSDIYKELELQISFKNNRYKGEIYADKEISKEQVESLQKSFSKKFGADITFKSEKSNYKGVKIEIDDLGVETSFSLDRLKAQMAEHILKAI
ncbi:MAG: F0F1 ATP synthase subunit delta [Campylobacteraceae bacterium]|jgi:F-type H+-transporting ATPase subunit delta|nr:F0F1 ATP synthase subunit delta [Campylobacteraceae bacterium]